MITLGDFKVGHNSGKITVGRADQTENLLDLTPGEADLVATLVGDALRLESLPVLLPHIEDGMWRVIMTRENLTLESTDGRPGALVFQWREGDSVIRLMGEGKAIHDNDRAVHPNRFRAPWSPPEPDFT